MGNRNLKVLQVFSCLNKGGAESRVMDLYRQMIREDLQFDFLVTTPKPESQYYTDEILRMGGIVHEIKSWREIGLWGYLAQWKKLFIENKYHVIHSHLCIESGIPLFFAWMNGVGVRVAHARSSAAFHSSILKRLYYFIVRWMTNVFSNVKIYCSKEAARFVFGNSRLNSGKLLFLPNAVKLEAFRQLSQQNLLELGRSIGLSDSATVVGTVGNARYEKNHIFLVKIFHELLRVQPEAVLIIVGDHNNDEEAKSYIEENDIKGSVLFLGKRDDVPSVLQLFNVFLLPSISEGAPGVVIEAQAANIACILSDSITREVDVGTGLVNYMSLNDPPSVWVNKIVECIGKAKPTIEQVHCMLRANGYDVSVAAKRLEDIYLKAIQE